jgi:hypothetical protein
MGMIFSWKLQLSHGILPWNTGGVAPATQSGGELQLSHGILPYCRRVLVFASLVVTPTSRNIPGKYPHLLAVL